MKFMKLFVAVCVCAMASQALMTSCNDLSDQDYFNNSTIKNTNVDVTSTQMTVAEYIQSRSDLSQMSELFAQQGIYDEMPKSGELHTVLVVGNLNYEAPAANDANKIARSHVTNISVAPSKLTDGDRLLMWHNKYVTIKLDSMAMQGNLIGHMLFNKSSLLEIVKAADGYIYVISDMIYTPTSLQDYINNLDESKYGRFKSMVLSAGTKEFKREQSKVIGIDANGNTVYDSIFEYRNTFFEPKGFDLSSEALTATVLLFSDEVIEKTLTEAKEKLHSWDYDHKTRLLRNGVYDDVYVGNTADRDLENWILQAAFFRQRYTAADLTPNLEDSTNIDYKSIYDIQWRTTVQQLDLEHPIELSNATVYEVKSCRIPNNRLIYRLHEDFTSYEKCDADQKAMYFRSQNLASFSIATNAVAAWTPLSGVWPEHSNSPLTCKIEDPANEYFRLDVTPLYCRENNEGGYDIGPLMVPPGAYRMAMGFVQSLNMYCNVQLFAVSGGDTIACAEPVKLTLDGQTTYHYDRGATLNQPRYPEFYNKDDGNLTAGSKNQNYWNDGGPVYNEIVIPEINGPDKPVQLLISMWYKDWSKDEVVMVPTKLNVNHWCLRPTANNY